MSRNRVTNGRETEREKAAKFSRRKFATFAITKPILFLSLGMTWIGATNKDNIMEEAENLRLATNGFFI